MVAHSNPLAGAQVHLCMSARGIFYKGQQLDMQHNTCARVKAVQSAYLAGVFTVASLPPAASVKSAYLGCHCVKSACL